MKRLGAIVSGRVQGVSFRSFVFFHAKKLGLKGFVRNLPSGNVEIVAEGEEKKLESLLKAMEKGNSFASVSRIEKKFSNATNSFGGFEIRYD